MRKIMTLLLAAGLCVALLGCGSKEATSTAEVDTATATEETSDMGFAIKSANPNGYVLSVSEVTADITVDSTEELYTVFDIKVLDATGNTVPDETLTISIPAPAEYLDENGKTTGNFVVYQIGEDGSLTKLKTTTPSDTITFKGNGSGQYALCVVK